MTYRVARDPYWLNARFASNCPKCSQPIKKGARIFYYPSDRIAYCAECGAQPSRDFEAARADERGY